MTLSTLNYGNFGIFLIMGNAGFCPSAVCTVMGDTSLRHNSNSLYGNPTFYYIGTQDPLGIRAWSFRNYGLGLRD